MMMPGNVHITHHHLCDDCHGYYEQYDVDYEEDDYEEDEHHDIDADPIDAECEDDPIPCRHAAIVRDVDSDDPE